MRIMRIREDTPAKIPRFSEEDIDEPDYDGRTQLHNECYTGMRFDHIQFLIDRGANVNRADHNGCTPLFLATEQGHLAVIKLLIERGADVNKYIGHGLTPLHNAGCNGRLSTAKLLLENGADGNITANEDNTPPKFACQNGHHVIAKLLIEKGVNVHRTPYDGRTQLHRTCW
jgi:ankyrin repeat protein